MKKINSGALVILAGLGGSTMAAAQQAVRTLDGLGMPESVIFDAGRDVLYVSSVGGDMLAKDGNGVISRVSPDGQMVEAAWIAGLDAPKGLVSDGTTLHVSDIDRLVAIDFESGKVSGTFPVEGDVVLNDTAMDDAGRVHVSDILANRIHVLSDGAWSVLAEGEALQHPNGVNLQDGRLVVATWGKGMREDLTTEVGGHLLVVDPMTGAIAPLGSGVPVGNLDGLEPDGKGGWMVTDFIAGAALRIAEDGTSTMLIDLDMGSADLEYIADRSLLIVPMTPGGKLVACQVDQAARRAPDRGRPCGWPRLRHLRPYTRFTSGRNTASTPMSGRNEHSQNTCSMLVTSAITPMAAAPRPPRPKARPKNSPATSPTLVGIRSCA